MLAQGGLPGNPAGVPGSARGAAAHELGHDDLRARADDLPVALELHDEALEVRVVAGAHAHEGVRLARHAPGLDDLVVAGEPAGDLVEKRARGVEELDERFGVGAERRVVDERREALQGARLAQPVHPPFDGGRGKGDVAADVVVGPSPVFEEQCKDVSIRGVYMNDSCTKSV